MSGGLLVVGGGPAGHSAAVAYREAGGTGPVRLVSGDARPPYERPPLSKGFLRGDVDTDELALESADFYADHDIEVIVSTHVTSLDPIRRSVTTDAGDEWSYDTCVLATGSLPGLLPVEGGDHPDVLRLRMHGQAEELRRRAESAQTAVVVGSGFIGCEAAASLSMRGLVVTLVTNETAPQAARLGPDAARRIAGFLDDLSVRLVTDADITSVVEGHTVTLADGSRHRADLVLTAVGVEPQAQLADHAGLGIDRGRVVVDAKMRTVVPGLFAAGDVACARHRIADRALVVEHWGEALAMGEIAGTNAAGGDAEWTGVPGFWSEIGDEMLKYAAWGDGFDTARFIGHGDSAFTVWYESAGVCVGVLTHDADDDYDRGTTLVEQGSPIPPD